MAELLSGVTRAIVFDTLGQYGTLPGYVVISTPKALREYVRARLRAPFRILYQPLHGSKAIHFEAVCQIVLACGWMVFAVDEVDMFCSPGSLTILPPKEFQKLFPGMDPGLYSIVNYSRHKRLAFVCTSRRPQQVARELTSQCSQLWIFRMTEPNDLAYFAGIIGPTYAETLPKLGLYEYLAYSDASLDPPRVCGGVRS